MNRYPALWPSFVPTEQQGDDSICAVSASGTRIRFADGQELLCATSGLWNANLGYGNAAVASAIGAAARDASYLSVFRTENNYARQAAVELIEMIGQPHLGRVMFSTSGGAANDLATKIARQHFVMHNEPLRRVIVGLKNSYHGLTFGSFALTGQELNQQVYGVDQRHVRHVPPNSIEALTILLEAQGNQIAAFFLEPVLGTGTVVLDEAWLSVLFHFRERFGFLIVADEVATGYGRTGTMLATSTWPEQPDILILSKGLTNGTCASAAVVVSSEVAAAFSDTGLGIVHGETQAGTAVSCSAISATLREFRRLGAVANGQKVATHLSSGLAQIQGRLPATSTLVGKGLFLTLRIQRPDGADVQTDDIAQIVRHIRDEGAIVYPGFGGIQLIPALVFNSSAVEELLGAIERGVSRWCNAQIFVGAGSR